jgi:hypothetical protein
MIKRNTWQFINGIWTCNLKDYTIWHTNNNFICPHCKTVLVAKGAPMVTDNFRWLWKNGDSNPFGFCKLCKTELNFIR